MVQKSAMSNLVPRMYLVFELRLSMLRNPCLSVLYMTIEGAILTLNEFSINIAEFIDSLQGPRQRWSGSSRICLCCRTDDLSGEVIYSCHLSPVAVDSSRLCSVPGWRQRRATASGSAVIPVAVPPAVTAAVRRCPY